ncbi:hypothetical protein LTS02_018197, partial [Friedmanniomyces endolithicus]
NATCSFEQIKCLLEQQHCETLQHLQSIENILVEQSRQTNAAPSSTSKVPNLRSIIQLMQKKNRRRDAFGARQVAFSMIQSLLEELSGDAAMPA